VHALPLYTHRSTVLLGVLLVVFHPRLWPLKLLGPSWGRIAKPLVSPLTPVPNGMMTRKTAEKILPIERDVVAEWRCSGAHPADNLWLSDWRQTSVSSSSTSRMRRLDTRWRHCHLGTTAASRHRPAPVSYRLYNAERLELTAVNARSEAISPPPLTAFRSSKNWAATLRSPYRSFLSCEYRAYECKPTHLYTISLRH